MAAIKFLETLRNKTKSEDENRISVISSFDVLVSEHRKFHSGETPVKCSTGKTGNIFHSQNAPPQIPSRFHSVPTDQNSVMDDHIPEFKSVFSAFRTVFLQSLEKVGGDAAAKDKNCELNSMNPRREFYHSLSVPSGQMTTRGEKSPNTLSVVPASCRTILGVSPTTGPRKKCHSFVEDTTGLDSDVVFGESLAYLTRILDLEILDEIVSFRDDSSSKTTIKGLAYDALDLMKSGTKRILRKSPRTPRDEEVPVMEGLIFTDPRIQTAYSFLCGFGGVTTTHIGRENSVEWWIRKAMRRCEKYCSKIGSMFPFQFNELMKRIATLLVDNNSDIVLTALQLVCLLFSAERRERLGVLLHFMAEMASHCAKLGNCKPYDVNILRDMLLPLMPFSNSERVRLMEFLIQNHTEILKFPDGFRAAVSWKQISKFYTGAEEPSVLYCQRMDRNTFSAQWRTTTEAEIRKLLTFISEDTSLTTDKKLQIFSEFQSEYPEVFEKHFCF